MSDTTRLAVAVETPQHAGLARTLDYASEHPVPPGTLVRVPLGRRTVTALSWDAASDPGGAGDAESEAPRVLKPIAEVLDALPALPENWRRLVEFAAQYYQRGLGELAMSVLPPELKRLSGAQLSRRLQRWARPQARSAAGGPGVVPTEAAVAPPALSAQQSAVLEHLSAGPARSANPVLLHGVTGSGKTEVYLRCAQQALDAAGQVLMLVPEINLTPQLMQRVQERFAQHRVVAMHSALTPAQRLHAWVSAHLGQADIVLGTRLAVFTPMPRLALIVVDEEHDPSFKQQEGARYSARDLAVYRGRLEGARVILGSATPSLESWQRSQEGRYQRLSLSERIGQGAMPRLRIVDMNRLPRAATAPPRALSPELLEALEQCRLRGEQSLLLLNRRGYAPVLHCTACTWKSQCAHCSAWRVFHKVDRTLRCHHCGHTERVPRACPECGNLDVQPIGRGTEKLEEQIGELLPLARVARIDADTTRTQGTLHAQMAAVHGGQVDVLVGTQMVTKGHDFRRVTLVAAVNPDSALFASDFRAAERLFALLMQAAGRAGRDPRYASHSQMWVQTWHPHHPVFAALAQGDYEAFAREQLAQRQQAGLPPFVHLALVRAQAPQAAQAQAFLQAAAQAARDLQQHPSQGVAAAARAVQVYPPVPSTLARVADMDRVQMLLESSSRSALQQFLSAWHPALQALKSQHRGVARWAIDVDPLEI